MVEGFNELNIDDRPDRSEPERYLEMSADAEVIPEEALASFKQIQEEKIDRRKKVDEGNFGGPELGATLEELGLK
jgi:hypothetical protein